MSEEHNWPAPLVSEKALRELRGTFINKAIMYYMEAQASQDPKVVLDRQGQATAYADAIARVNLLYEPAGRTMIAGRKAEGISLPVFGFGSPCAKDDAVDLARMINSVPLMHLRQRRT